MIRREVKMKVNPKLHPQLFKKLKTAVKKEINKHYIVVEDNKFKTNVGRAYVIERIIKIPSITDLESIYIIFHEIGHIKFKHHGGCKKWSYIQEFEAETFALRNLRKLSIHRLFPEEYKTFQSNAILYIVQNIYDDIENGLKVSNISPKVLAFCRLSYPISN